MTRVKLDGRAEPVHCAPSAAAVGPLRGRLRAPTLLAAAIALQLAAVPAEAAPAPPPSSRLLEAIDLACQRGERALFEHLALALAPGSVVWLRGRNGRGKTSLLRLLASLATPMAGQVRVFGEPRRASRPEWRRGLVYIGHQNALKDDLTASEALAFLVEIGGTRPAPAEVDAALARLGVAHKRRALVRTLSQGQRRRVTLARLALAITRPLWLLDEPFDALDADGIATLNELLAEHAAAGGATLLTSHQALSLKTPVPQILDLDQHGTV